MSLNLVRRVSTSPLAFPLAAMAALVMFFLSETSYGHADASLNALSTIGNARLDTQTLWRSLLDAETGQRGYLLTGRPEYLKPYVDAQGHVTAALDGLEKYYAQDPVGRPLIIELSRLANEKLSELSTTLKLKSEGKETAWRELLLTNIGKEKMDAVRNASQILVQRETQKINQERERVSRTILVNRIGVSGLTALSLLALFMYFRQTAALDRQRNEQQNEVKVERDHLEKEVQERTAQLTELARHLQTAREDERSRLARDLHDELGALLTAAKLDAARLKSRLGTALTPDITARLTHLNETLNSGIALKRRIIEDLRPSSLSNLGLVAALDILTREFSERTNLEVLTNLVPVSLSPSGELMVYRLVQEALTNIAKYANAKQVNVKLFTEDNRVEVFVKDDGIGFDIEVPRLWAHGLLGMRYRVEAEGGIMTLKSSPGHGTVVQANLPSKIK